MERYAAVEVVGLTVEGEPFRGEFTGWPARILQHEVDHLDGVLYVDRMLTRSFSARGNAKELPPGVPPPGACSCCHSLAPADGGA